MTPLAGLRSGTAPLTVGIPEDPGVCAAFSRRATGNVSLLLGGQVPDGQALLARARLAAAVGLSPTATVYAEQVHGAGVARVGLADRGRGSRDPATAVRGVDALVTADPGVAVAVLAADCVPLLLAAPGRGVAAVHAGRRGFAAGVVRAALDALVAATGVASAEVVAIAGPAIGGCCYEVPAEMAERVAATAPAAAATTSWGTPALDLRAGVVAELRGVGVARVEEVGGCTRCGGEGWFSARSSAGSTLGDAESAGRHAGIICRTGRAGSDDGGDR